MWIGEVSASPLIPVSETLLAKTKTWSSAVANPAMPVLSLIYRTIALNAHEPRIDPFATCILWGWASLHVWNGPLEIDTEAHERNESSAKPQSDGQ